MKVIVAIGTRPEAIKMAPVIQQLRLRRHVRSVVCATGQHRQMLDQSLAMFNIVPDIDFDVMRPGQTLNQVTSRIIDATDGMLQRESPDLVLVHGDTSTAMAVGLASAQRGVAVGHVEAGLRTYDMARPFPEEMNRRMVDLVARYLFAPTETSRQNLIAENADANRVFLTGNTVVDALMAILSRIKADQSAMTRFEQTFPFLRSGKPLVLVTGHRRESHGRGLQNICRALVTLSRRYNYHFVYPVHLNPSVALPVQRLLQGLPNVFLLPPVSYLDFIVLLSRSHVVITDSGGVQEEAVSLGKPVLVTRDVTERPEGIEAGLARLVGTQADRIVTAFDGVANGGQGPDLGCRVYGDGRAAERIVHILAGPPHRSATPRREVSYEA